MQIGDWILIGSASATFLLATAAFWTIWQNHIIQKKNIERQFKTRALDDIRDWVNDALEIKSEYTRVPRFETVDSELLRRVEIKREVLISQKEYVIMQARLFQSESLPQLDLTSKIERLAYLLEFMEQKFNDRSDMLDFDRKSTEALRSVFEIRANERL